MIYRHGAVSCWKCSATFNSVSQLQSHHESLPSHGPDIEVSCFPRGPFDCGSGSDHGGDSTSSYATAIHILAIHPYPRVFPAIQEQKDWGAADE